MQGKQINGFILKRPLGVGGMAEVWYAENEIHKPAAIKLLNFELTKNEQIVERFRNEAEVMVRLDHRNIRQVYGYGMLECQPAIIMEYLEGDDLKAMLKSGHKFIDAELVKWWNQMVSALGYTHSQGVVHRDIKPSNIFIDRNGDVKLMDFGIAKIGDAGSGTQTGSTLGTRLYMSPEQVKDPKRVGIKSDNYSLAVSFVHLLTGKAPYDTTTSSDFDIQLQIVSKPLDLSGVPEKWCNFLLPYLDKDPDKRAELKPFGDDAGANASSNHRQEAAPKQSESIYSGGDETVVEGAGNVSSAPKPAAAPSQKTKTQVQPPAKKKSRVGLWVTLGVMGFLIVSGVAVAVVMSTFDGYINKNDYTNLINDYSESGRLNGHAYVDLGLSVNWATCNVGAYYPEDYGDYYAWGETSTKSSYTEGNYKYSSNPTTLPSNVDVATELWGGEMRTGTDYAYYDSWRMPTKEELEELQNRCSWTWTTKSGTNGYKVTGPNGNSIFLPAAGYRYGSSLSFAGSYGYYWSISLRTDYPFSAWYLYFNSDDYCMYSNNRCYGFTVRPVCVSAQN